MSQITSELLRQLFSGTPKPRRDRFIEPLNKYLPLYGIDNALEVRAFLATGGVETDYLKVLAEYATGEDYEGRKSLGNTHKGDGVKFKGMGFFQTTGRFNFEQLNKTIGAKLGIDFTEHPQKLLDVNIAIESACIFWHDHNLGKYANDGDFRAIQGIVNTGHKEGKPNQWQKRLDLYRLCTAKIPDDFNLKVSSVNTVATENQPVVKPTPSDEIPAEINSEPVNLPDININNSDIGNIDATPKTVVPSSAPAQETTKQTPSFQSRVTSGIAYLLSGGTLIYGMIKTFFDQIDAIPTTNLIVFGVLVLGLAYIGYLIYDRAANRSNATNAKLIDAASSTEKNTVNFVEKK